MIHVTLQWSLSFGGSFSHCSIIAKVGLVLVCFEVVCFLQCNFAGVYNYSTVYNHRVCQVDLQLHFFFTVNCWVLLMYCWSTVGGRFFGLLAWEAFVGWAGFNLRRLNPSPCLPQ